MSRGSRSGFFQDTRRGCSIVAPAVRWESEADG
jgi:hypothetical protein